MIDVGLQYSLTIILKMNNYDFDYLCGGTVQGFRVGFHSPIEIPRDIKKFVELSPNHASLYVIEPKLIRTHNDTRKFRPHERQCFFNYEHKLRFFKQYTEANCVLECLSNYTLSQCGCVHFSMLRRFFDLWKFSTQKMSFLISLLFKKKIDSNDTEVCGNIKMPCYHTADNSFYRSEDYKDCDCLPSCTALSYDAYVSTNDFNFVRTLRESKHNKEFDLEK